MSNYTKDPEEVLKQRIQYKYALEEFEGVDIVSVDVVVKDSSNNDVTAGIVVADSISFDNTAQEIFFYIQGGVDNGRFVVNVTTTFSNSFVLSDSYYYEVKKQYVYLTKQAPEVIPITYDYKEAFGNKTVDVSSYTVQGFRDGILMNYVASTTLVDNKLTAMIQGGILGERLEIVFKVVSEDLITTLVDRIYVDIR
jgi:hypothetical protein